MQPLELIDQMLARTDFNCTRKQMEFLRKLVVENQNADAVAKAAAEYKKKQIAQAKREVTFAKKEYERALENLEAIERQT